MPKLRLSAPPPAGAKLDSMTCLSVAPWRRKSDGAASFVITWAADCLRCKTEFVFKTGLATNGTPIHCEDCRAWLKTPEGRSYLGKVRAQSRIRARADKRLAKLKADMFS